MELIALTSILLLFGTKSSKTQVLPCDTETELVFQCEDGNCTDRRATFCNGNVDCPDGSDEYLYNVTREEERGIRCQFQRGKRNTIEQVCHLPHRYLCDHELDCVDGKDECDCRHTFQCANGDCAIKVTFCDGIQNCQDFSDELKFNRTSKIGFQCPVSSTHETNSCVLPEQYLCDGDSDCDDGIDECFCEFTPGQTKGKYLNESFSNDKCFRCLDRSLIIPNNQVCDGVIHCQDLSDECLCTGKKNYTMPSICNAVCDGTDCDCKGKVQCITGKSPSVSTTKECIPEISICDNKLDCINGEDEKFCPHSDHIFQCYDNKTIILISKLCNGNSECPDDSDEKFCNDITDYHCFGVRKHFPTVSDWENKTETSAEVRIPDGMKLNEDFPLYAMKCDGVPRCSGADDECYASCPGETPGYCKFVPAVGEAFRCKNSGSLIVGREICDGKPTCNDTAPELSDDELYCPNRFYCSNNGSTRLPIHLPLSSKCNGIQECDDQSDELNCSETTHYYCDDGGTVKFIRRAEVCDGTKDCHSGSDECRNCNPSPFSSDQKLISSRVLVIFLWIIGIVAVAGNFLVILHQVKNLLRPEGSQSPVAIANRILVLNLSLGDIFVGIYLVSLGVKDAMISDYCQQDQEWRTCFTCSALGTLVLIGTENSVFILLIMTAYRLHLVLRPFSSQNQLVVKVAVGSSWFFSFLLALLPHVPSMNDYFVSCVWYRNYESLGLVCRHQLEAYTRKLAERSEPTGKFSSLLSGKYTWANMFDAVAEINSTYRPERYFGYYSAHSVCLPRLFPDREQDISWGYSLFLILLNFFAFIFIMISYMHIYRTTTKQTSVKKAKGNDRAADLQKKVTRIVATDFCCWMPICIMAFLKVSGIYVSDIAYALTAIILLPINAAMNPFLYSDVVDYVWERIAPVKKCCKKAPCREPVDDHSGATKSEQAASDSVGISGSSQVTNTINISRDSRFTSGAVNVFEQKSETRM